uniref:Uncharacterized protein n=1 Tax=Naja naja TaxID=35670 RepID=A0A8C6Y0H4_NAJNA
LEPTTMWWTCPKIKKYWTGIKNWIEDVMNCELEWKPELFLLGMIKKKFPPKDKYLIAHLLTAARIVLAQKWKEPTIPSTQTVINKMYECVEMERLTVKLNGKEDTDYYKIWEKWYNWMEHKNEGNGNINKFGELAGLKVNKGKTKLLVKNITNSKQKELEETMGLQIANKIKYLGIWIRAKTTMLWEDNYIKILEQIKKDLEIWSKMQISLLGRIATIKMNILPKVLYLFQTIPILTNKKFFTDLDRMTMKFIWLVSYLSTP